MAARHKRMCAKIAVCTLLLTAVPRSAKANSIPTSGDIAWIGVAIAAIGAGIGIGIFYAIHHGHSLTGCVASDANGLELQNEGNQKTYALVGDVAQVKAGERIRVSGKKAKSTTGPSSQFIVENLSKDFGACRAR